MSSIYVGRRKSAVALVRFIKGNGDFVINEKPGFGYLQQDPFAIQTVVAPLKLINLEKKYNIICLVRGGGISAQAEAIQLGIARAICSLDSSSQVSSSSYVRTRTRTPEGGKEGDKEGGKEGGKEGVKESEAKNTTKEEIAPYTEGKEYEPSNSTLGNSQTKTRSLLKEQGYLRRDSRIKERRKYGLKKARKAEQYSKR